MSSTTSSDIGFAEIGISGTDGNNEMKMEFFHEWSRKGKRMYDVFLSFNREDAWANFTSDLYASLQNAGIIVFKDDESLSSGDHISESRSRAIKESKISVVVFSKEYGQSRRCLQELEKIIECDKTSRQLIVPVFYNVRPYEVYHQTGDFGEGFQNLCNRMLIDSSGEMEMHNNEINLKHWRDALREVAYIPGVRVSLFMDLWDPFRKIVVDVIDFLDNRMLFIVDNPVGLESRAQDTIKLLDHSLAKDVVLFGIWGVGGIGKTTIARAVYHKIGRNFEGRSFLARISEVWEQDTSQVHLQEQLLLDIYKEKETRIPNIESGQKILKERLHRKKVLLVLDDVNMLEQLNALCGSREWFGSGSRIIITTRDMHILRATGVDRVYRVEGMDESESLELFSWHAFKQPSPKENFIELSRNVITSCKGLPLLLEVLGSYLFDTDLTEWKVVLQKLKNIPNEEILEKLKISFDGLNDDSEKEIFLDIACFFIRMNLNDVIHILNGRGFFAENGVRVLVERSLVTVDERNKLGMHNLIRDMGMEIMLARAPKQPSLFIYDVFLSFRGKDTRASFTSHLYASLHNAGIIVFKDDKSLSRGNRISDSLLQAIEQSKISIVVLSRNYAESRWCLKELEKIMECHRTIGKVVVPVFYDVDPSEVRHQTGEFGKAFQNLSDKVLKEKPGWIMQPLRETTGISGVKDLNSRETKMPNNLRNHILKQWREALREVGAISGVVVLDSRNENEAIKNIVENVTHLLDKTELFIADNPVGIESRVQDVIKKLGHKLSNDVVLFGIWGMGGIGKTTIAKAIYNKIGRDFEGRSFLAQIREVWGQDAGQVHLQEQLLQDIYKEKETRISNVPSGKNTLMERLCHKRVLLVLDDVNDVDQLSALCGSREWFRSGSRIIITTRDMHILRATGVDKVYAMKGMDESESLELFSWHAFKQPSPKENFIELSRNVIKYSGGLPLALEVLGSYLFDMKLRDCEIVLEKLKKIPNDKVYEKLKISFDGLNDDTEREIFLDIACFFIGMDRYDVIHILNSCGFFAENGVRVLVERSLVTIDEKNNLGMHDLLRNMGREIVRAESLKDPEKRSRIWSQEDVLNVLLKKSGTKTIEGLTLMLPRTNTKCFSTKAFKKMKKLRLLQLAGVQLDGDFINLSRDLRWLCWNRFSLECMPVDFYQESLVSIELENSNVRSIWKEAQLMEKLKILNLSHSPYLTETPNFLNLPNLEKLTLRDCPRLTEISHSIGNLKEVILINLEDCVSLHSLPRSIYKLKSLKTLILSGCLMIDKLEEDLEQMESLTTLMADKTAIKSVPFSIVRSKSIGYISLCGHEGFSRDVFPSIIWSWMSPTNNPSCLVQSCVDMSYLVSFNVPNNSSHDLLIISKDLPNLRSLWVECNSKLQLSRDTKIFLDALYATTNSKEMESSECNNQVHISTSKGFLKFLLIQMGMNCRGSNILKESILQTTSGCDRDLLPGDNYPDWLTFNCDGSSVIFYVPQVNGHDLKTMMFIIESFTPDRITSDGLKNMLVINHTKLTIQVYKRDTLASFENEEWQRVVSNIEPGNKMEVVVVFENGFIVKKTTVYFIYDEPIDKKIEYCHASDENVAASSGDENISAVGWISPQVESTNDFKQKKIEENVNKDKDGC